MSLQVRNINFQYKNVPHCRKDAEEVNQVLKSFSADFASGEVTALTGDNGSGKTTLSRIIMGILTPSEGSVFVDGTCIDQWTLAQRGRLIGYVMQNPARQIFCKTVKEEIEYGIRNIEGLSNKEVEEIAAGHLEMFGLAHQLNAFPFELSHGEKQRLVLASVLAMKPKYLILDEPTASLDTQHKAVLGELLREIARPVTEKNCEGCGVIVISHDKGFISRYCDREVTVCECTGDTTEGIDA